MKKPRFLEYFQQRRIQYAGGGGSTKGGGEGSGGTPEEEADTLLAKQFARIIDVWSEGEIEGWAHEFPLQDIYMDGTPVQNDDAWGVQSNGNTVAGSKVFTTTGGAEFEVFRNSNGVIKPHKSPMCGRWIREPGYEHIPFGAKIDSVEGPHSCTLDTPATANGVGIDWQLGGSVNFKDFGFQYRFGTQDQTEIDGFPAVEATFGVGTPLLHVGPDFTRDFTDATLDAARVDIEFRQMEKQKNNGDLVGTTVRLQGFLGSGGQLGAMVIDDTITGKCTSPYVRTYLINFAGTPPPWRVTFKRVTEDSQEQRIRNPTYVSSYTEVTYGKLRYPNTAYCGLRVNAKNFPSIPTRAYHLKGIKVKIPRNYDPVTRNYAGVWDGTFKPGVHYTNNPAWELYDMAMSPRYGLGNYLVAAGLDKWALYQIARYCDGVDGSGNFVGVPDGFGGREPRFAGNLFIQRKEDAIKVLQDMAGVFRGILAYVQGTIVPIQDAPTDPTTYRMFSPANVVNGQFNYSGVGLRARHNVAIVSWSDLSDVGRIKQEYVEDHDGITKAGGINQLELTGFACTSRGQARRIGLFAVWAEKILTDTVSFTTALEGYFVTPGKIVQIQDPFRAGDTLSGRITTGSNAGHLLLDRPVVIASGMVYFVGMIHPTTGLLEVKQVTNAAGTFSDINCVNFSFTPEPGALFQLAKYAADAETPVLVPELARVLGCMMKEDNLIEVTALKYNASLYDFVDFDHPLDEPPISQLPPAGSVLPPTNFRSAVIIVIRPDGSIRQDLEVTWGESHDPYFGRYRPTYRIDEGNWVGLYGQLDTDVNSFRIQNATVGDYEFLIYAINTIGAFSPPLSGDQVVDDPPTNITGVQRLELFGGNHFNQQNRAEFQERDAHFVWGVTSGGSFEPFFGEGPLETEQPNSVASGFRVAIFNDDEEIWTEDTTTSEYVFTWEKNNQAVFNHYGDGYGPLRIFRIEVRVKFDDNTLSDPARLTVENPPPPPPINVVTQTGNGYVAWQWQTPDAPDIDHFSLYASLDPEDDDPEEVARFNGTSGIYYPPLGTFTYWLGTVDSFGTVSANVPQGPPPGSYVRPPTFAPPGGTYQADQDVVIAEATQDCSLVYALVPQGQNPTQFTPYTAPVHVTGLKTLHAVAYKNNPPLDSNSAQADYTIAGTTVSSPEFDPPPGFYEVEFQHRFPITMRTQSGTMLFWTLNGTDPTYDIHYDPGPGTFRELRSLKRFDLTQGTYHFRAIAVKPGFTDSSITDATYLLIQQLGIAWPPPFTVPNEGSYPPAAWPLDIVLDCHDPSPPDVPDSDGAGGPILTIPTTETAHIKYTTNGQIPSRNGPGISVLRGDHITLDRPCYLKMVAYSRGHYESMVVIKRFRFARPLPTPIFRPPAGSFPEFPMDVVIYVPPGTGRRLKYTLDGSTPTESHGITIVGNEGTVSIPEPATQLRAIAYGDDLTPSAVASGWYYGKIATPTHAPDTRFYNIGETLHVFVDCDGPTGVTIAGRYTTDGTRPSRSHGTPIVFPALVDISGGYRELRTMAYQQVGTGIEAVTPWSDSDVKLTIYDWARGLDEPTATVRVTTDGDARVTTGGDTRVIT